MSPIKPTTFIELFSTKNYLDQPLDIEFERKMVKFMKDFKEDMNNSSLNFKKTITCFSNENILSSSLDN